MSADADGVLVGNVYDKYGTKNPIARAMMSEFLAAVTDLYSRVRPASVVEVGCGEGNLAAHLWTNAPRPRTFEACDVSLGQLSSGLPPEIVFREASIYELPWQDTSVDLVVCCEVLEHLDDPARGLRELARISKRAVLLSTPREPLWRALNLARGKYWRDWGNTPGHVQHFSRRGLTRLVERELEVKASKSPVPWTVLLGEPRR
ncbi:MAG: class I SAM-dependent methyltransferase [Myxococcales bacterium]|nr:class I SAM-dependent methyltransferase [Myxococcales bacterium]